MIALSTLYKFYETKWYHGYLRPLLQWKLKNMCIILYLFYIQKHFNH